ncbi:MAG: type II toxin-antitoxin system VapC family toxin [Chloroflexi bacterium]|nr:type II toxin-antitoxin system VapC family toxin [Chloroflexota bacterium]
MSSTVLDASALLALLQAEQGSKQVRAALATGAVMSAVNLSEVVAKLSELDMEEAAIRSILEPIGLHITAFDADAAYSAGLLRSATKAAGLPLGDRACLGLAQRLRLPVVTADRAWQDLSLDVPIRVIR